MAEKRHSVVIARVVVTGLSQECKNEWDAEAIVDAVNAANLIVPGLLDEQRIMAFRISEDVPEPPGGSGVVEAPRAISDVASPNP